jgi:[ribosomal protein S5]-alanine N-acetyltransferase
MNLDRVETERLVACRPLARDAEELHPVVADPLVADWLWPGDLGGPRTLAQTRTLLVRDMDHWKRHRFGPWLVRDRQTREVLGRGGLERTTVGGADEVEVAWLVASGHWGRGIATEVARLAVKAAFGPLGLPSVVAFTLPDNAASRAVMERIGMTFERDVEHAGLPHVLYRLRRPNTLKAW